LGQFNQTTFASIDYAIRSASAHHIRLVIPLTDNWHYYHGGKHMFTDWRGISDKNAFYTDRTIIHDFEQYISELLNHINSYTGIAYKDDPIIMVWETGNELTPPPSWTNTISTFIKSTDSHHLVIDGSSAVNPDALALPNVDIYTTHYYPVNITQMQKDAKRVIEAKRFSV
jgi:mannan endo-1,4-beta-mannosidase